MDRIEKLKQFSKDNPKDNFLKHALALEYIKIGNDKEAKSIFHQILDAQPNYVGSYYHLGKLYERNGDEPKAIDVYGKGMEVAKEVGDEHAFNVLWSAWEYLSF